MPTGTGLVTLRLVCATRVKTEIVSPPVTARWSGRTGKGSDVCFGQSKLSCSLCAFLGGSDELRTSITPARGSELKARRCQSSRPRSRSADVWMTRKSMHVVHRGWMGDWVGIRVGGDNLMYGSTNQHMHRSMGCRISGSKAMDQ